jgi:hypothetical protein
MDKKNKSNYPLTKKDSDRISFLLIGVLRHNDYLLNKLTKEIVLF